MHVLISGRMGSTAQCKPGRPLQCRWVTSPGRCWCGTGGRGEVEVAVKSECYSGALNSATELLIISRVTGQLDLVTWQIL